MKKTILTIIMIACCRIASAQGTNSVQMIISASNLQERVNNITNLQLQVSNAVITVSNAVVTVSNSIASSIAQLNDIASTVARLNFTNAVIHTGLVSSASFTNVNLAPYVGTNQAIIMFRVIAGVAGSIYFRPSGDTNVPAAFNYPGGTAGGYMAAGEQGYFIVPTGTNGIVECKTSALYRIELFAFLRRHVFD